MSGKSSTPQVTTPTPPPSPPSYGSQITDYISSLPQILSAQKQYDPKFAQQQLDLLNQFGIPMSKSLQNIDKALYPQTAGLQEQLAGQASQGMQQGIPQELLNQYMSDFNAGIGNNVNAPIGVSTRTAGLMQMQEDWKRYYQNLALTTAGRQPLIGPQQPNSGASTAGVGGALNYGASTYGAYAPAFAGQNAIASPKSSNGLLSTFGGLAGAGIGAFAGGPMGAFAGYGIGSSLGGSFR